MTHNIYIYILIAFLTSYCIRALPLTLIRKKIKNKTVRSFLFYVPYVTLSVMIFPAILYAGHSVAAGAVALVAGIVLAWFGAGLFPVAIACSAIMYVMGLIGV